MADKRLVEFAIGMMIDPAHIAPDGETYTGPPALPKPPLGPPPVFVCSCGGPSDTIVLVGSVRTCLMCGSSDGVRIGR